MGRNKLYITNQHYVQQLTTKENEQNCNIGESNNGCNRFETLCVAGQKVKQTLNQQGEIMFANVT